MPLSMTITATDKFIHCANGAILRLWKGRTPAGLPMDAFVTAVGAVNGPEELQRELQAALEHSLPHTPPPDVWAIPDYPHLPGAWHRLAEKVLSQERATPDHILLLADALDEAAAAASDPRLGRAATLLSDELRRRAPDYA